jgi:PncC family amidohydrolase
MPAKALKTLATAESCTGGLLGALITKSPGASRYYRGGIVAYDNSVKSRFLGVSAGILRMHGAVSAQTAERMAAGARRKFRADIGVSITGIAGPSGGSPSKPAGLVYIALSEGRRTSSKRFLFKGPRERVRRSAAAKALAWFRRVSR